MPADSANWGIGEATAVYQSGGAFGTWNYQDFIKGFFEDPATQAKVAGKNVHLHTPAGPNGVIDPCSALGPSACRRIPRRRKPRGPSSSGSLPRKSRNAPPNLALARRAIRPTKARRWPSISHGGCRSMTSCSRRPTRRAHPRSGMGGNLRHHGRGRQQGVDRRDRLQDRRRQHGEAHDRSHAARWLLHARPHRPAVQQWRNLKYYDRMPSEWK